MGESTNTNSIHLEALRQTELRLEHQVQMSLAADQRAVSFAGLLILAATVVAGISYSNSGLPWLLATCGIFILAAVFSALSSAPIKFWPRGGKYDDLEDYTNAKYGFEQAIESLAKRNDDRIGKNHAAMTLASRVFIFSQFLGFFGAVTLLWRWYWQRIEGEKDRYFVEY